MNIFRSFEEAKVIRNPVVTTGSFDGVHIGHKAILDRLKMLSEKHGGESVLITFNPHPRMVLYPETIGKDFKLINTQEEKLELLEKAGLNNVIIVKFTREFSKVTSEQFVREFLHEILHAKVVVVGFNHHFGFNKEGDYKKLWAWQGKYNFDAEEIPEQDIQHETVSSTKIRKAISEGNIQRANAYLDHYYIIIGRPEKYITDLSLNLPQFVRIPITDRCKLLPSPGIYAVSTEEGHIYSKGMAVIFKRSEDNTEVLLNFFDDQNFPVDHKLTISFHKKISGPVNLFDSRAILKINSAKEEISDLIY